MASPRQTFILTDDHITLLSRAYVRWEEIETGAPAIDGKRPYGNSDVPLDVAEELGWEVPEDYDSDAYREMMDAAMLIHRETETALQIILRMKAFEPGTYELHGYDKWIKVS